MMIVVSDLGYPIKFLCNGNSCLSTLLRSNLTFRIRIRPAFMRLNIVSVVDFIVAQGETFFRGADKQDLRLIIVAVLQRGVSWRKKRNMRMERERDGLGYGGHLVMVFTRG